MILFSLCIFGTISYAELISQSYLPPHHHSPKYCPAGTVGTYPNCLCKPPFIGHPPNCRAPEYLPPTAVKCPAGFYGTEPNCHEPCPPYHIGYKPVCERMKCPPGYKGEFQPDCVQVKCPAGEVGTYPYCQKPKLKNIIECPDGLTGYPPDCHEKCPQHQYGRPPNCKRIKCPSGWLGDYQPNCTHEPTCPHGKPGRWPHCNQQYCAAGTVGTWPDCVCAPGTSGIPPDCRAGLQSNGYLPPLTNGYLPPNSI